MLVTHLLLQQQTLCSSSRRRCSSSSSIGMILCMRLWSQGVDQGDSALGFPTGGPPRHSISLGALLGGPREKIQIVTLTLFFRFKNYNSSTAFLGDRKMPAHLGLPQLSMHWQTHLQRDTERQRQRQRERDGRGDRKADRGRQKEGDIQKEVQPHRKRQEETETD